MEYLQQIVLVSVLLGLIGGAVWLLQRRGMATVSWNRAAERRMQIVEKLPLTAQHAVHMVRIGDKLLLIGTAPGGCSLLGPLPEREVLS